jgi:hypothetical protein
MEIVPEAPVNLIAAVLTQQENTLSTFVTLLVTEERRQQEQSQDEKEKSGLKGEVVNETTCKP